MHYDSVRNRFLAYCPESASMEARQVGVAKFVAEMREKTFGIVENENGRPTRKGGASLHEWDMRGMAMAFLGPNAAEIVESAIKGNLNVWEAGVGSAAITPANVPNVSAYLGSVSGLLEAAILEGYESPGYVIDELITTIPSKTRQRLLIGIGKIGDKAERRSPGEGHAFVQFGDRTVRTQPTFNDALAGAVTFEAMFFDQTSQVLVEMNKIGEALKLRKEKDGFRLIAGVDAPYNYNGVSYNTYLTSGNWINDLASNALTDHTAINAAKVLGGRMTDQENGERVAITYDTILVSPEREQTANFLVNLSLTQLRTPTTQAVVNEGNMMVPKYKIQSSVIMDQILTDSVANGGLGLTQSQANGYWWLISTGRSGAFVRTENWPVSITTASANSYTMLDKKLVLAIFCDQQHSYDVQEPRKVIRSKVA